MGFSTEQLIRLPDGRRLGFAEYGVRSGRPIFYFHGFPGSRLEGELTDAAAGRLGIRLISPDRPGFGLSDFQPQRTLLHWPADVTALADALGIQQFGVLGLSGGGPYAAACAARLADRLTAAGIVAGLGPLDLPDASAGMPALNRFILLLYRRLPFLGGSLFRLLASFIRRWPEWTFSLLTGGLPAVDRQALFGHPRSILVRSLGEALSRGDAGGDRELFLYSRPWGLDLRKIKMEVLLWHGDRDATVPIAMGRAMADQIPRCRPVFYPEEGHFSLPIKHLDEILGPLAEAAVKR